VVRWAEQLDTVFCADVQDAYWSVSRREAANALEALNSPVALLFKFIYGAAPVVTHGTRQYLQPDGLLPGCGGAQFAFTLVVSSRLTQTTLAPDRLAMYADDATAASASAIDELARALHPMVLVKIRDTAQSAIKILGSFIGPNARQLAHATIDDKCAEMMKAVEAPLSKQARLALLHAVERSVRHFVMVTNPAVISDRYGDIDDAIIKAALRLAPTDAMPTRKTSTLLFLPSASGGCGFVSYGAHGQRVYDAAAAPWPPVPLAVDARGFVEKQPSWAKMREVIDEVTLRDARPIIPQRELNAMVDASTPWHGIARITKYDTIRDEDWELMWAHTLAMRVPYATCAPAENTWDHIHGCPRCHGGFPTSRHERVVTALNAAAKRFGVVCSTNFFSNFGVQYHEDHPDVVFYRAATEQLPLVVDVTVRHQSDIATHSVVAEATRRKVAKYKDFFPNDIEFHPLVFTAVCQVPAATWCVIQEIGKQALPGFASHALRRIKCAIVQSAALRRKVLSARNHNSSPPLPSPP
jgi:hypothetical protein